MIIIRNEESVKVSIIKYSCTRNIKEFNRIKIKNGCNIEFILW